jgi:deazaflavin-dependent oxidoreductase (nitroreductase family)
MMPIPDHIRYVNKRFTNKGMMLIAGKKGSPIAVIRHKGRKSGTLYHTPVLVVHKGTKYIFALTYGKGVDWFHNILAAGRATLRVQGQEHNLVNPVIMDAEAGCRVFGRFKGAILKAFKVEDFFVMEESLKSEAL